MKHSHRMTLKDLVIFVYVCFRLTQDLHNRKPLTKRKYTVFEKELTQLVSAALAIKPAK